MPCQYAASTRGCMMEPSKAKTFLDGANFKMHEHRPPRARARRLGIRHRRPPHLVALTAASSESRDA